MNSFRNVKGGTVLKVGCKFGRLDGWKVERLVDCKVGRLKGWKVGRL